MAKVAAASGRLIHARGCRLGDGYGSCIAPRPTHDHSRGADHMPNDSEVRRGPYADVAPALDEITQSVLFGDIWERPGLSKRDRSLVTVATLVALYRTNELPFHVKRALENG